MKELLWNWGNIVSEMFVFFAHFSFTTFDNWDCYYIKKLTFPHEFSCVYPIFHWGNIIKKNVGKSGGFREKKGFLI